jgi:hypothetical protein
MRLLPLLFLGALLPAAPLAAQDGRGQVVLGQVDDFQNGTTQGWGNGFGAGSAVTNQPGGPGGPSDRYLRIISDGSSSQGKLVVFNTTQWTGDYTTAGVGSVSADVSNAGTTNLALRVWVEGPGGWFVSTTPVALPAGSGWQQAAFPVTPATLTFVVGSGTGNVGATLSAVSKLRIYHSPTATAPGPFIVATLGLDNITAGPPPPSFDLTAMATSPLTVPAGGSVSFAYTIANNTGASAAGDLWYAVTPGSASGVIRSGTLPGGQAVSGNYTQPVPGTTPPGTYTYRLRIGQYPSPVVDEVSFTIVVTPAPRRAGDAEGWAVRDAPSWRVAGAAPEAFASLTVLEPPVPNPASGAARIAFALDEAAAVRLAVYDVLGREVAVLVDGPVGAGAHVFTFDGHGLPAGVYVVRLAAGERAFAQRLTLVR